MTTPVSPENAQFTTLSNGLRVMICQQTDAQTSYVSMAVKAGHFYDPEQSPGLAHLLEHMLFMGSRHLPKPNSINDFIEHHGGTINAWTGTEYANYHYQCPSDVLATILPVFADMLRTPLLEKTSLRNEIQAIEAEFQFKRKDDLRRLYQIHKETSNPAHPFSKFSVGNAQIFEQIGSSSLRDQLQQFHQRFYVASNMCLCIISPHPTEEIEALVTQWFSNIDKGKPAPSEWPAFYRPDQLGVQINIVPLQSARRMIVTFALPGIHNNYRTRPLHYISHLLGDEGDGSLLAFLKSQGWVINLIAGSGIEGDGFKDFNVSFQLTESGQTRRFEILNALFACLKLIRESVHESWRFDEKAQLNALAYQYEENPKLLSVASDYAQSLFIHSFEEIRKLRHTIDNFDVDCLNETLSYFTVENMRIKVIAPDLETDCVCQFYDAQYSIKPLPDTVKEALATPDLNDALYLPPPNPYLGEENKLVLPEPGLEVPRQLVEKDGVSFWFAQDQQFHSPKGDIFISFENEMFSRDLTGVAAKRLWLAALNDYLQAKYYRAEIAGLHYRLYGHQAGFTLHTRGFTDQQMMLAGQLLDTLTDFEPAQQRFAQIKQQQQLNLQNSLLNKPTNRLFSRLSVLIQKNTHAPIEMLEAVNKCSYKEMLDRRDEFFRHYYIEALVHGNWTGEDANSFASQLTQKCPQYSGQALSRAVAKLNTRKMLYHKVDCDHDDAAVVLYLQAPSDDLHDTAMCMILEQMLASPFFNALRTEKQLGYIVGTGYVPHNQHPGISFYVQSPGYGPDVLLEAITTFLHQQLQEIDFYKAYWDTIKGNLLKQLEERDLSLSMKSQRLWVSLGTRDFQFNRNHLLAHTINEITFDQIQQFAIKIANREVFGELVLYAPGKFEKLHVESQQEIHSIAEFKGSTAYFSG